MKKYYIICYVRKMSPNGNWDFVNLKIDVEPTDWLSLKHAEYLSSGLIDFALVSSIEITKAQYDNLMLPVA